MADDYQARTGNDLVGTTLEKLELLDAAGLVHQPPNGVPRGIRTSMGKMPLQEIWFNIPGLSSRSKEKVGLETQKPVALLKRIIACSSNPGDIVLDPFCGSGTTLVAAHELGRQWVGIEINDLTQTIAFDRLRAATMQSIKKTVFMPMDVKQAQLLAREEGGRQKFQDWVCDRLHGTSNGGGGDDGVDGYIVLGGFFVGVSRILYLSVKYGGHSKEMDKGFLHTVSKAIDRPDSHVIGGAILTFADSITQGMRDICKDMGIYDSGHPDDTQIYDKVSYVAVESLFDARPFGELRFPGYPITPTSRTKEAYERALALGAANNVQELIDQMVLEHPYEAPPAAPLTKTENIQDILDGLMQEYPD